MRCVEESVFIPLQGVIVHSLQDAESGVKEQDFVLKLNELKGQSVEYFGYNGVRMLGFLFPRTLFVADMFRHRHHSSILRSEFLQ